MLIADLVHLAKGDVISCAFHAIKLGIVFLGLIFIRPGNYSADKK